MDYKLKIGIIQDLHYTSTSPRSRQDVCYFKNLLSKLDYVFNENDIVISLGDTFNHSQVSIVSFYPLVVFLIDQIKKKKKFYAIEGNHDLICMNQNSLSKTALGLLEVFRLVKLIRDPTLISGVLFDVIPFQKNRIIPVNSQDQSILLGHYFYQNNFDLDWSVTFDELAACRFDYICLGHDHEPHQPMQIGNSTLLRPGSITRNTSNLYNLNRQPHYIQVTVVNREIQSVVEKEVRAYLPEKIFKSEVFQKPASNPIFLSSIETLLECFGRKVASSKISLKKTLEEIEAPEDVIVYLESIHKAQNLKF